MKQQNQEKKITKIQEMVYELKISDVMKQDVITVEPHTLMSELRTILRDTRISGTPVIKNDKLIGIISIEDFIKWLTEGAEDISVESRMSSKVKTAYSDEPLVHAIGALEKYGYGRLPIIERETGKLAGIVTKGTVIEGLLRELEIDYHEDEIRRYRASHFLEDIIADKTTLTFEYNIEGNNFAKAGTVASGLKKTLLRLGIGPVICRRVAIVAYESEMNIIFYTDGGNITVFVHSNLIHMEVRDSGPGIADIEKALEPGYSTAPEWVRELGFGAGMGLVNIKKCADEFKINSKVNKGTELDIKIKMEAS
jgi:CBS domain-containing protein/anti-sigma regulatory factor (Ser/Thr protein kinase)